MSDAWNGRPQNPERDGWHWVEFPGVWTQCHWWIAKYQEWSQGVLGGFVLGHPRIRYLGPCATPAELAASQATVRELVAALRKLTGDVDALIADSGGVYGLHMNGDPAPWDELTEGGRFEEWLLSLSEARAALARTEAEQ
jgi:hypothetical protein